MQEDMEASSHSNDPVFDSPLCMLSITELDAEVKRMTIDRTRWRHFVDALCPIRDNRR
jgi:hypothetical protein